MTDRNCAPCSRTGKSASALMIVFTLTACTPAFEEAPIAIQPGASNFPINGGRTQAVTVNPNDRDDIVIALQWGGMWRTTDGGANWKRILGLNGVHMRDVQYGTDGQTLIATSARSNHVDNQGGIWRSANNGRTWNRPTGGRLPASARSPDRGSASGIALDPDDSDRWFVGTDHGIALSTDNGVSWTHVLVNPSATVKTNRMQGSVQSVLAFPGSSVLALLSDGIYRSDSNGAAGSWTRVIDEGFGMQPTRGFNKMDRLPFGKHAIIQKNYSTLLLYELDSGTVTRLDLPEGGGSRGPFVRVGNSEVPGSSTIWASQGTRIVFANVADIAAVRSLQPSDWIKQGRGDGIHDDMGDLGLDADLDPVMIGSDGGVFRPDPATYDANGPTQWLSAAAPGSGMNSYQITDIGGNNVTGVAGMTTSLYFSTQDNMVWGSHDGGASWPQLDCCEGFHVETRPRASVSDPITVAYGRVGAGYSKNRFADRNLLNRRNVPDMDTDGNALHTTDADGKVVDTANYAFYVQPDHWVRIVRPQAADPQVYTSTDNGQTWRKRFQLSMNTAGVFMRSMVQYQPIFAKVYLPVKMGTDNPDGSPRIGLIRMWDLFADREDTIGTAAIIELPDNGSLGRRATEFDWQAVYRVHPKDSQFLITADIVNARMMISHDGGNSWATHSVLTDLVTRGGELLLWDGHEVRMQVTDIRVDPYRDDRILIGTRDAGIICTGDRGITWKRIPKSERINYATGFHFLPDGSAYVVTYGRGMWKLKPRSANCADAPDTSTDGDDSSIPGPTPDDGPPTVVDSGGSPTASGDPLPSEAPDDEYGTQPISANVTERARVLITTGIDSMGGAVLGSDHRVSLRPTGFGKDARLELLLDGEPIELRHPLVEGQIAEATLPSDLAYGVHHLEIRETGRDAGRRARVEFRKVFLDEHLGERSDD